MEGQTKDLSNERGATFGKSILLTGQK